MCASSSARLPPLKTALLSRSVVDVLRNAIFDGRLAPGEALRELHLARELRVSQATVREALAQLDALGLVVRTPNIGTRVTALAREEVVERLELRLLLEGRAIALAAPRMDDDTFAMLRRHLDLLAEAIARNAYFESAQADLEFHRAIWRQSGNRTLARTLDQIAVPLFAFVSIVRGTHHQSLEAVVQSHEGILAVLREPLPAAIEATLRQHFRDGFSLPGSGDARSPS